MLYDHLVKEKRAALQGKLKSSIAEIEDYASSVPENVSREDVKGIVDRARREAEARRLQIEHADTCSKLDALGAQLDTWKETQLIRIDSAKVIPVEPTDPPKPPKPKTKVISRSTVLPTRALKSEEDVNAYVEEFRLRMLAELEGFDSIRLGQ